MDYAGWVQAVCPLLEYVVVDATSATPTAVDSFNNSIPAAIDYTENRLQRDLDLVSTTITSTGAMTANSRIVILPSVNLPAAGQNPYLVGTPVAAGSFLTTTQGSLNVNVEWEDHGLSAGEYCSILTPVVVGGLTLGGVFNAVTIVDADNFTILAPTAATSTATAEVIGNGIYVVTTQIRPIVAGRKQPPLEVVTRDYLDYAWPDDTAISASVLPQQWCPNDQTSVIVGPAPYTNLPFEVVGTMRIPQLSSSNYTNFLTQFFPDLYVMASMIYFSGMQANYGAQASDPKEAISYEMQYQALLKSAQVEETRKTFANMWPSPSNPGTLKAGG